MADISVVAHNGQIYVPVHAGSLACPQKQDGKIVVTASTTAARLAVANAQNSISGQITRDQMISYVKSIPVFTATASGPDVDLEFTPFEERYVDYVQRTQRPGNSIQNQVCFFIKRHLGHSKGVYYFGDTRSSSDDRITNLTSCFRMQHFDDPYHWRKLGRFQLAPDEARAGHKTLAGLANDIQLIATAPSVKQGTHTKKDTGARYFYIIMVVCNPGMNQGFKATDYITSSEMIFQDENDIF